MEAIHEVGIAADADGLSDFFGDPPGDEALKVGQSEDVHIGGFIGVAGPPVGVHV